MCGYVRGYSNYSVDAFGYRHDRNVSLDGNYVDGVSITYGTPPSHIWTYAAGNSETRSTTSLAIVIASDCPCNTNVNISNVPSYVGSDYYCESGNSGVFQSIWYTSDPLWDVEQCGGMEGPCCNHTGLPWFNKNITTPTTASIKVRVCLDEVTNNENLGIERLELYVK